MQILTSKDEILRAADKVQIEEFEVPEWSCKVLLGLVSGQNREKFEHAQGKNPPTNNVRAMLVSFGLVDRDGNRLFEDKDIEALNKRDWRGLNRIYQKLIVMNLIGDKHVEAEAKNS